jgi:nitrogen fixation/metabolism regulation signal transduction histidine kinase
MRLLPGIAGRTALLLILVAGAVSAVTGAYLQREEVALERAQALGRAEALAESLQRSATEAMAEHRPASMAAIVAAVKGTPGVAGLALADREGRVRFRAGEAPDLLPLAPERRFGPDRLTLARPVENGAACQACHAPGPVNGAIWVSLDTSGAGPRLAAHARRMVLLVALALAAIAAAVLLVLRTTLVRPLHALTGFAEALGRGDLSVRPPAASGEAGVLARALGGMAEQVQRSHAELESRVAERTRELAAALAEANAAREARAADLERLQALVDSMVDGVIFIDAQDRIALVNKAGRALRNLKDGEPRPVKDCHPKAAHGVLDRVMGYLRNGDDAGAPHSIIKEREGRYETTYAPVTVRGAYVGTVMVIRDIAERRTLERRLLDAERLAGLGQMSAQIAHELRNPLNAIDGAAQYLSRRFGEDGEVKEYAGLIGEEVQRVNRFISELLGLSRPAEPNLAPVSVNRLLREAAQKAAIARGLAPEAVALDLAGDLPVLDVDAPMITEALVNLLQNAFDAGGSAPPELASRFESAGGEGTVVVEVRDRGCGIPPDQLDEVLRPFVTTKASGTGLGLVIVTRAVEQHRARFALRTREGGGVIAEIRFPVRRTVGAGTSAAEVAT